MFKWMEPCSSLQKYLGILLKKPSIACLLKLMKIPTRAKVWASCKTLCLCGLSLFWALSNSMTHVRNFSYSDDQDHIHVHSHNMLLFWKIASISIHHKIKLQIIPWPPLSLSKYTIRDVGYTKRNKRCIPKEGMPHAHKACQKKKREKKIAHIQEK